MWYGTGSVLPQKRATVGATSLSYTEVRQAALVTRGSRGSLLHVLSCLSLIVPISGVSICLFLLSVVFAGYPSWSLISSCI